MDDFEVINVNMPKEVKQKIISAFGPFETSNDEDEAINRFAALALGSFVDWIMGAKRYRTLTEQYIDWIEQLYMQVFAKDEVPNTDTIYNSMNMPYGQASYIARVLSAKTLVHWRAKAIVELKDALKDLEQNARQYIEEGDQSQNIQFQISKIACQELIRVCSQRRRIDRSYMLPLPGNFTGDFRFVSVPACTIIDLLENNIW